MHISIFVIIINSKLEKSERQSMVFNAKYHWPGYGGYWLYKKRKTWVLQLCKFQRTLDLETKSNFSTLNHDICCSGVFAYFIYTKLSSYCYIFGWTRSTKANRSCYAHQAQFLSTTSLPLNGRFRRHDLINWNYCSAMIKMERFIMPLKRFGFSIFEYES